MATLLFLTVYNFFRNFGERGYATKLEEMLEKASEAAHTAKQGKDDEKCELEGDACGQSQAKKALSAA
jgi:hypothetical protein